MGAAIVALALAMVARTQATVVVPADLGELSRDARAIARGRVAAVDGRWTEDRRTIETIVTLEVESYLKGSLGATLQFRVPGGELGRYRSVVVGAPEFVVDQRVIVFLGASGPMVPYVLGLNQGVYRIVAGSDRAASTVPVVRGDVNRRPLALADFEQRVRALAGGAR
jgi:hypothetical protein